MWRAFVVPIAILAGACSSTEGSAAAPSSTVAVVETSTISSPDEPSSTTTTTTTASTASSTTVVDSDPAENVPPLGSAPPEWIGTELLPLRPGEDNGVAQPTPPELVDRQLWTTDTLPPPAGSAFEAVTYETVPDDVLARSSWAPECPVAADELAYATVTFWGFDGLAHTGELLTNAAWVEELVAIFGHLYDRRFPIEEMRVTTREDIDAHPTGDRNNTGSFACRPAVTSENWSEHARGLALDINPFHNPYIKGDLVIPELAESYTDRANERVGMIDDDVIELFDAIGWGWGGRWSSASDWMHFSASGH